jgi:uncharacterized membrane protein YfcA
LEWYLYLAVVGAGFAAGFINTLAGSGSLITLPLLIFIGLPPTIANGTNRVGILLQNIVAVGSFRQQKMLEWKSGLTLAIPAVLGSLVGAQIAVDLDERTMERAIGVVMVAMLFVILFQPNRWLQGRQEKKAPVWLEMLVFFAVGAYGGFIQAGVGVFVLAALVLVSGFDVVRGNAVKVLIILLFTISAIAVFLINGQVNWGVGLLLALGSSAGAWVGCRVAFKQGARFVRWILIAVVVVSALDLLGVLEAIGGLF